MARSTPCSSSASAPAARTKGLRADWQRQLTYAHRECGFEYIRMHGLFTDDMGVYREDKRQPGIQLAIH